MNSAWQSAIIALGIGWAAVPTVGWAVPFQESGGQVVIEAENFDANIPRSSKTWTSETAETGYAGVGYLTALPNSGLSYASVSSAITSSPELQYQVNFTAAGTYYVWVRGHAATTLDDALHAGLDGTAPASSDKIKLTTTGVWNWTKTDTTAVIVSLVIPSAGLHTINVWMNEDGFKLDRIILTTSATFTPSGTGPAESPRGSADTTPPTISGVGASGITTSAATIAWTTNEASTTQVDYGTTTSYGQSTTLNSTLVTSHSVSLSGLSTGTLYHYRVRSKDTVGNEAIGTDNTFTTTAPSDTTPPTGSVTINAGAAATNSLSVTLTLSATDNSGAVSQMQFSNDGTTYSSPQTFAVTKTWTLSTGDGTKTISAKFKDAAGNWSNPATDTIALDTTPPGVTFTSPADGAVITSP